MVEYKREFIKFLESAGVLKFGDFTAKSGRKIPYFINAGDIKTGEQISKLGEFYARAYKETIQPWKDIRENLYSSLRAQAFSSSETSPQRAAERSPISSTQV